MLLYRYTKMMEEQSRLKGLDRTEGAQEDENLAELLELRQRMSGEVLALLEEDCSDWAAEATY
ncbi:hypothetical protein [Gorillibacterium sp. sgz5001074]|uniref:hypothetical protein n=1 Tax=Gorillibacterium sp. sgz5001074 TaxID=3446695 RepID=UPI003F67AF11